MDSTKTIMGISELSPEKQQAITRWIMANIHSRKTPLTDWTSYSLKHLMERDIGLYCDNDTFKAAMLECGFSPVEPCEERWQFCISKRSPAFRFRAI